MTHITAPAASAAIGVSTLKTMSDVIDSLKRLERVGSENSKTTQKLLLAAKEIERKICARYSGAEFADRETPILNIYVSDRHFSYSVCYGSDDSLLESGGLFNRIGRVSENRTAALLFSEDIANGLLELIVSDLSSRHEKTNEGFKVLDEALEVLRAEDSK